MVGPINRSVLPIAPKDARKKLDRLYILWRFVKRYPRPLSCAGAALVLASLSSLAMPVALRNAIDKGFGAGDLSGINDQFKWLVVIILVMSVASATRFYFVTWIGERVVADVRLAVHRHLLTMAPSFFEDNRPAEVAARLTGDTAIIETTVGTTVSVALRNIIMLLGGLGMMVTISPKLMGIMVLLIPIVILPLTRMGRHLRALSRGSQDRVADIGAIADEAMGGIKIVQAFTQEPFEQQRFSTAVERAFAAAQRRFAMRALMTCVVMIMALGGIVLALWTGAQDVIAGHLSGGAIAAFVFYAVMVGGSIAALTEVWGDILRAVGASSRLDELLRTQPSVTSPPVPRALPAPPQNTIDFDGVTFHYPSRPEVGALQDFTLHIQAGETVAIVGPSGAGKSTLFQLLLRFYDPQKGTMRLDGVPLNTLNLQEIRSRMAIVPQESIIFAATAYENIRYGRQEASEAEIWAAADAAHAGDFLRSLPEGIHTFISEGGARLSGGQRQRIAIARAILRNAPILLLDEATSALDAESEKAVQTALEQLMRHRTTLVIAHRLATVMNADRIIVLDQGRIVAEGDHQSLIAQGGLYTRLAELQFQSGAVLNAAQ